MNINEKNKCVDCGSLTSLHEDWCYHAVLAKNMAESKKGIKHDTDKIDWSLLPMEAIEKVIRVLMYGSQKYKDFNWIYVEDRKRRYINAVYRHLSSYVKGEQIDDESGLEHLAHACCSLLFLLAESQGENPSKQMWFFDKKNR